LGPPADRITLESAVAHIRSRYEAEPDPDRLLGDRFTVLELRKLHEAVAGEELDRDMFRREMRDKLTGTAEMSKGTRGRPAELFRRRGRHEPHQRVGDSA
jgi:8-oxo-dGTP diphosphatase